MAMAGVPLVAAGAASECKKARCSALPQVLALDCEMCETVDDATGARDGKALVRMSIVDGAGTPLLDTLVAPRGRVVDMRTSCHGITPEHLRDCRFTLAHAQAAVARLCCPGTVLVGHALHNDLQALGMVHERVVDTSFLFALEGEGPSATPSLRDLAKAVLDKEIQSGSHSSVTDAVTALEVAQFALDRGAEALPLIKRGCGGGKPKNAGMRAQLLVHRIPLGIKAAHLTTAFTKLVRRWSGLSAR
ncbi:ribonuclease H-like domain-containing protein [Tribonema minus]|uniref:Ribonuclease H-like domain-containing protein n=1 Tax=Tribonema minus TaxID=303371 RepID=A0A836CAS9_9STRA|nr:ribonuclease H-like domain-containing protein [Tribonema minus]